MSDRVLVIVVTYNAEKWIDYCFSSFSSNEADLYNIDLVCIDNASTDNTVKILKKKYPKVELVLNKKNLGFGKANNIGFEICLQNNYDFVFLLNQDASIDKNAISQMIAIAKDNSEFGILSPIHRSKNNNELEEIFSHWLNEKNTHGLIGDLILKNEVRQIYETKFVNAAIWLITRNCLTVLKEFDPDFPHYGEDNEFIHRALLNGFKVGICPHVLANHSRPKRSSNTQINNISKRKNRAYVELLVQYKTSKLEPKKRLFYFFRRMMIDCFQYLIFFNKDSLKITLSSYYRLFFARHKNHL